MAHVMERARRVQEPWMRALRNTFWSSLMAITRVRQPEKRLTSDGKTDILIRQDGRNIFIGECKFWGGPKKLTERLIKCLDTVVRDTRLPC